MIPLSRLVNLSTHFLSVLRPFSTLPAKMAELDIKTKYKMLSGYEIPVLGFGVSGSTCPGFALYLMGYRSIFSAYLILRVGSLVNTPLRFTRREPSAPGQTPMACAHLHSVPPV